MKISNTDDRKGIPLQTLLTKHIIYDIIRMSEGRKEENMFQLEAYETDDGHIPLKAFLDKLNDKHHAKALRDLELLEVFGPALTEPQVKHLDGKLWELRTTFAGNISRIIYFMESHGRIILLNGFVKKTAKTPVGELDKAKRYMEDWKRRN